jgi:uncharacterized membrane protein
MKPDYLTKKYNPEKIFVYLAFFFGILLLTITPPFQVPDEPAHLYRAYQISEFTFKGEKINNQAGGYIPSELIRMTKDLTGQIPFHPENKASPEKNISYLSLRSDLKPVEFIDFKNTVLYSPLIYIPQSTGVAIARLLNLPPVWMLYLGRFFNLSAFVLIVFFAIKTIPFYKWGIVLFALMPMTLAQVSSLSADSMTIALSFLLFALILRCALVNEKPTDKNDIITIAVISFILGMSKSAYILLPFLVVMIPSEKFPTRSKYYLSLIAVIFCSLCGLFVWSFIVRTIYVPAFDYVKPFEQLLLILKHPVSFLSALSASIDKWFVWSFFGILGWTDTPVPKIIVPGYILILIIYALFEKNKPVMVSAFQKTIAGTILLSTSLMIAVMIYLTWNKVGAGTIVGLQGRYFIPVAPLFLLLCFNKRRFFMLSGNDKFSGLAIKNGKLLISVFIIITLTLTLWAVVERYYL